MLVSSSYTIHIRVHHTGRQGQTKNNTTYQRWVKISFSFYYKIVHLLKFLVNLHQIYFHDYLLFNFNLDFDTAGFFESFNIQRLLVFEEQNYCLVDCKKVVGTTVNNINCVLEPYY